MRISVKIRFFTRKICASHKLEMRKEAAQEWRFIMEYTTQMDAARKGIITKEMDVAICAGSKNAGGRSDAGA